MAELTAAQIEAMSFREEPERRESKAGGGRVKTRLRVRVAGGPVGQDQPDQEQEEAHQLDATA